MATANLNQRYAVIDATRQLMMSGDRGLTSVPPAIERIIENEMWRDFDTPEGPAHFDRFEDFVCADPLKGMGATMDLLKRLCKGTPAEDALDRAMKNKPHANQHTARFVDISNKAERPDGTARAAGLRRLRKDRPDLHKQVMAGAMSVHAAMLQAGFRRKTVTVYADADSFARAIVKHLGADALSEIGRMVRQMENQKGK